jgi:molybdenum storage protein
MNERHEIESKLRGESLVRRGLLKRYENIKPVRIAPELNVVKIGGHGLIDYGAPVVKPLMEEIGGLCNRNQMLVVTGGGARVRHIMDLGLDLGLPTGVLAELAGKISEQNAIMVSVLLSEYGGTRINTSDLLDIPTMLRMGLLPVIQGTPPYGLYEYPTEAIPQHRTDTGAFIIAEVLGAKSCVLLKNTDGLYTEDPFKNPEAELIGEIRAEELLSMHMEDMVLEGKAVELLLGAKNVREIRIVNGHKRGYLQRALEGENVGTVIRS